MNPNGFRKFVWDCVICVVLFYAGIITPFLIAFVSTCTPRIQCPTFWIDCLCDGLFFVDAGRETGATTSTAPLSVAVHSFRLTF